MLNFWIWGCRPTLMSLLKFLIGWHPAFSRWKFAHRSSSSSGDSFIRSARVSPSLSNAANAVEEQAKKPSELKAQSLTDNVDVAAAATPSFRLSSMSANSPILMICHRRPSTRWGFPSIRSEASMFTTWQPMAEAEFRARFRFSCEVPNISETLQQGCPS